MGKRKRKNLPSKKKERPREYTDGRKSKDSVLTPRKN